MLLDSFSLKHRNKTHCNLFSTAYNNSSNCFVPSPAANGFILSKPMNAAASYVQSSNTHSTTLTDFGDNESPRYPSQTIYGSSDNLLANSHFPLTENSTNFFYDNPCLAMSYDNLDAINPADSLPKITFSTFRGEGGDGARRTVKEHLFSSEPDFDESFTHEKNQNSRNSIREMTWKKDTPPIVYYSPKYERARIAISGDETLDTVEKVEQPLDESPNTQNLKNSRLSLEYKNYQKHLEVFSASPRDNLQINESLSKSDLNLSCLLDKSISKVHTSLSDSNLNQACGMRDDKETPTDSRKSFSSVITHENTPTKISPDTSRNSLYDSVHPYEDLDDVCSQTGLNGVKPAIPPRDQKRAPARPPKDNRLSQNNNVEQTEPTQQQLHSIQKYKEQLRKRKDEEEKQEYLNRSLRGSRKLHALESHSTSLSGQENQAYAQDEFVSRSNSIPSKPINSITSSEIKEFPKPLTYGEVVATLERLQLQLRNVAGTLGVPSPGVEAKLEAVRTLLIQRRFATALATHHALRNCLRENGKTVKPLHHTEDAANLARDCVEVLEQWQTSSKGGGNSGDSIGPIVEELTSLLTSYEIEGLLLAHDSISSYVDGLQRRQSPSSSSPSGPPSPTSSTHGSRVAENIKIIRIEKTNEPLGATVRNEGDAVIIGRVVRGGAADKSGLLHEGDEVLEVNGVEMRGKSVNEVCDILAGMQGSLTFLVLPAPVDHRNNGNTNIREDTTLIQHVRAHFDYDPEEDPYIPCRELGVSFQKGDVLHVISQEDPSWWQAYREGEEDQTLAGLVPSKSFQHQRESMKQTIAGEKSTGRGSKKSSTLLCARKNPKKKKRSKSGSNFNDDGYPLYATTAIDDYDSEEVLTYEEVALYYPRANHKRPIVLIGPPNIGRHELRQRLMQDSERFAAAIPHTSRPRKDSEVDGQDYHFISRSQFESDILCRKFVEHGEYEKAYYGTSVEAIRSVVNSGKICVLNLHPQSLKILRSSDLKPYVVFVAPPSLEKLRQKRIKNNENFKEDELKDIIEKARDMEDKYGHLFDMIIINNDTDRAYNQLLTEINSLEREPQWVPASWLQ
ncbi:protein PALS1 isoform X3 [Neodiprion virginianus]|uniref:protein PALS1 isoform X3 n=1 Tax=Neodiprion virginianus TaxID=2961670 RepID=UPI001EE6C1C8|nr:protein PALS1 isoform X3 [Neodiprion virginianus]